MFYVLYGEDAFRAGQHAREMIRRAKKRGDEIFFAQGAESWSAVFSFLLSVQLFDKPRIAYMHLRGVGATEREFLNSRFSSGVLQADPQKEFVLYCESEPPVWFKAYGGQYKEFKKLEAGALATWVDAGAVERGIKLERPARELLMQVCGNDTARLGQELDKLGSFKPGGTIGLQDLEVVGSSISSSFFQWIDAVLGRDQKQAVGLLVKELEFGADPIALLASLTSTVRILAVIKNSGDRDELREVLENIRPFWLMKHRRASGNFSSRDLQKAFQALFQAEHMIKTGRLEPALALEHVVLLITAGQRVQAVGQ